MITAYKTQIIKLFHYVADKIGFLYNLDETIDQVEWSIYYAEESPLVLIEGPNLLDLSISNVSKGRYKIEWEVPVGVDVGRYFCKIVTTLDSGETKKYFREFEVVENEIPFLEDDHLCLIRDAREQGLADTVDDWTIAKAIIKAQEFIEMYCRRIFSPRFKNLRLDPRFNGKVLFPEPVCVLEDVLDTNEESLLDTQYPNYLYARHLRSYTGSPAMGEDDRNNPKLEANYLYKNQTYWFNGVFGYTEQDGSEIGKVPEQVRLAAINLTLKYQASLLGSGGGSGTIPSFSERIIREKTATQEYELSPLTDENALNMVAGDTELARLLNPYKRPALMEIV